MNREEIVKSYEMIEQYHRKYLKEYGVKLPALLRRGEEFSKEALVLVKLFEGYPDTKIVSKDELTRFMRQFYPETVDVQQARHLSMQKGGGIFFQAAEVIPIFLTALINC